MYDKTQDGSPQRSLAQFHKRRFIKFSMKRFLSVPYLESALPMRLSEQNSYIMNLSIQKKQFMSRLNHIINRIKEISGLRTDADVAKTLGLKPNTLSERKARDSVPFEEIFRYCVQKEIYLDWILTGVGPKLKTRDLAQEPRTNYGTEPPDSGPYDEKVGELKRAIETTKKISRQYHLGLNDDTLSLIINMVYIHGLSNDAIRDLFRLLSSVKDYWSGKHALEKTT